MGVEYSTFHPVTASVCKQCRALNFPGCRNHKQLLAMPYGVDGIFTRCPGGRCDTNTAKSRFPCTSCSAHDYDVYRVTMSEKELERVYLAFKQRCGSKDTRLTKFSTCLLICTECSAALFPIISDKLCVANSTGQIVDEAGQAVDLALWQEHFAHCNDKCPGAKGREFLARIDVVLIHAELDYAKKKIKASPSGRWQDFKYTTGRVRAASQGSSTTHRPSPYSASSAAGTPPPSSSSSPKRASASIDSLSSIADLNQTHPVAVGVCKQCVFVNFPGCAKHRCLLSKPYEVVDGRGKTTYAGCSIEGCETNTRFAYYVCAGCKGKDFSWYHIVLTDKEGDYLLRAWQGRGLGFSANSKLSHSITICNLCLCAGFPGAATKLCESKHGKLISPVTNSPMDVSRWKDTHAHIKGCPGVGRVDVLMRVDMVLHGPEVQYLAQNLHAAARGHWNSAFVRAGHYYDPSVPPAPHSSTGAPSPYPPPTAISAPYMPGSAYPYPTMPAPYPMHGDPSMGMASGPFPPATTPYPPASAGYPPAYQQTLPGAYPQMPTGYPAPTDPALQAPFTAPAVQPPPDASAYPFAAYAAAMQGGPAPPDLTSSQNLAFNATPYPAHPFNPYTGAPVQAPAGTIPYGVAGPSASTPLAPSAPPDDLLAGMGQLSVKEKEDETLCVICLSEKRDVIFYKCGHLAACHGCADQLKKHNKGCPICRQPILDIVKVFHA